VSLKKIDYKYLIKPSLSIIINKSMNADEARKMSDGYVGAFRLAQYQKCVAMIIHRADYGKYDAICSIEMGQKEIKLLRNKGYKVEVTMRDSYTEVVPVYKVSWD